MKPVVLIPACSKDLGRHPFFVVGGKYVDAVVHGAGCQPLLVPPLGDALDIDGLLDQADGLLLTGSVSNVHPAHFAQTVADPELPLDPARDATTLPLVRRALALGVPLFAICRGFQEVNVALGGSLHQAVHAVAGIRDHREDPKAPIDVQYGPAHPLHVKPGGVLARALGSAADIIVNSLHGQGVDRLGAGLEVEASAEDGLVEAFSVAGSRAFALGVQWHPEWKMRDNAVSIKLFEAFGRACRERVNNDADRPRSRAVHNL
ncbi:MAG: gamma-glutamyl-gamma-aminobutyrate hydrolase family protein [Sterolibacteriaceae bacterium]|uniref:gamma-glutamyl-gamma-aminobutyrate hydrolase n=1 Tax=Candidatus Methylophosphatis roskildensis TaxID=2899263 RepID=A0A9D7HNB2_9PROT|nr:gamma-glutamyl-gamma-aminobutyrate hydrolase family protein [Candidatus Methylophosphatis roskildensis]MBK7237331.1 gamma-glutamyl-gamma-aminobutyrate hydrolase family protein [Sterolibacteriaceae bacterium]